MAKAKKKVESWLRSKVKTGTQGRILGALGLFVVAALAFLITFGVVYMIIFMGFNWIFPHSHETRVWISFAVLVLLFVGNLTADRRYLESYSVTTGTRHPKPVTIYIPGVGIGSTINPLAPDSMHSVIKIVASIFLIAPRLLMAGVRTLGGARRLSSLDVEGCAAILALLLAKGEKAPFSEVEEVLPDGRELAIVLPQLKEIDGVLFLKSTPAGLSLQSDFREELSTAVGRK